MKLYIITQSTSGKYDVYDSVAVIANSEEEALQLSIEELGYWLLKKDDYTIEEIGKFTQETKEKGVVISSFNAG